MSRIFMIIYLVIGVVVASSQNYLSDIGGIGDLINLLLAIILWPLVVLGIDFKLKIGDNADDKKKSLPLILPAITAAHSLLSRTREALKTPLAKG